jgi:cytochrome P450
LYAILLTSAFGQKYKLNDPDLLQWVENSKLQQELNTQLILVGFISWMKYIYRNAWTKLKKTIDYQWEFMERKYNEHLKTFDGVTIRDFTDAMLMAKKEAEEENALDAIKYLKPWNIMNSIQDMFTAGSETSRNTLVWVFLLMAYYPHHQRRMRKEIEENISDNDIPTLEHRAKCHWTTAFIAETLRFRHIFPFNIPHKATVDVELGGHAIQQGTTVLPLLSKGLTDKEVWGDPDTFRPERFLDKDGKYISKPSNYYAPFSSGRRTCPGEKVALFDMFFIMARFLQKTKGEEFCLPNGSKSVDLYGDPDQTGGVFPYHFELILKPVSV